MRQVQCAYIDRITKKRCRNSFLQTDANLFQAFCPQHQPPVKTPKANVEKNLPVTIKRRTQGFASMSHEKQREISSKGGRIAQGRGKAHTWTPKEAREAGKKGAGIREERRNKSSS